MGHIGIHGEFKNIYVHKGEEDWLVNCIKKFYIEQIRKDVSRDVTIPTPETFNPDTYKPFQGNPTGFLNDGDEIEIGNRKRTIYHTPGHISILDNSKGYLFKGDLLYDGTPVHTLLHPFPYDMQILLDFSH